MKDLESIRPSSIIGMLSFSHFAEPFVSLACFQLKYFSGAPFISYCLNRVIFSVADIIHSGESLQIKKDAKMPTQGS